MIAPGSRPGRSPGEIWLWMVLIVGLGAIVSWGTWTLVRHAPPSTELPRLARVPEFRMLDADSTWVREKDLEGSVWMVNFMFTRCQGICPALSTRMQEAQQALQGRRGWKLVSMTMDGSYDTPWILKEYAERFSADPAHWIFLTGEEQPTRRMVREGFLLAVNENPSSATEPIVHSSRIVLVDRDGWIRGYYDSLEDEAMQRMVLDAERLLEDGG